LGPSRNGHGRLLVRRIGPDDATWDHPTFSKDRQRLLEGNVAAGLLSAVLSQLRVTGLVSTDHFSIDGTLI
jgi:transposase